MKTKVIIVLGITTLILALISACGGNNSSNPLGGCNGVVWGQEVSDELTAASEAGTEFGQNPTIETCEAYKEALRAYVSALKGVSSACIPDASEQEYQASIAEAEQSIDDIDCEEEVEE